MARTEITFEHPRGSGLEGCKRNYDDADVLDTTRGPVAAADIVVGDRIATTPRCKCLVLATAVYVAE